MRRSITLFLFLALLVPSLANAVTIEDLKAQVQVLLTQILAIQKETAIPATTAVTCPALMRNLTKGSTGADVISLQAFLIAQGHLAVGNNSGFFGALTESAVKSWQSKNGVVSSGTAATSGYGAVGPKTRAAMMARCGAPANSSGCIWNGGTIDSGTIVTAYKTQTTAENAQCESEIRKCENGKLSGTFAYATCSFSAEGGCIWNGQVIPNGTAVLAYSTDSVPSGSNCISQMRSCSWGSLSGSYQKSTCSVQGV